MTDVLALEDFASELSQHWGVDSDSIDLDRPLVELGLDSLSMLELVVMLEDFAGHEMPEELWSDGVTLRDLYASYEVYASRDRLHQRPVL